ncbi:acyl-CoA dehydrogenase family protein [Brevibacterium atlanticum]|uniref:acyl-CoA dehydrogenase family protein n=1 Tax=Brevibacterium atlanticum TaxID=2697563 RepID=UPI00142369AB|nr:acyl-CoA dehydrogenase family protein [Brevibacterium atlanticum]
MTTTDTSELLDEVRELCEQILAAHTEDADPTALIRDLRDAGLLDPQLLDDETTTGGARPAPNDRGPAAGGDALFGAGSPATAVIATLAAANAEVPIVEHLWNAAHLLHASELDLSRLSTDAGPTSDGRGAVDTGLLTAAAGTDLQVSRLGEDLSLTGSIDRVSGAEAVGGLLVLLPGGTVAFIPRRDLTVTGTRRLGSMCWSRIDLDEVRVPAGAHAATQLSVEDFRHRSAAGRLLAIRAAAERATTLTTAHLSSRVQFGRELRKFQAAQNRLSACIGEHLMLSLGAELALTGRRSDIAAARIDARRSVSVIRDHTHQLHGAMGITADYPLGRLTTNMIAWLADTGSDRWWTDRLNETIDDRGTWATITGEEDET